MSPSARACGHKSSVSEEAKRGSFLGKALEGAADGDWDGRLLPDPLLCRPRLAMSKPLSLCCCLSLLLFILNNPNL